MSKVIHNKCVLVRAEVEGKAYRLVSFFHTHPSQTSEDNWAVFRHEGQVYLIDKVSLAVMAEHECVFLTRESDKESKEPSIVSVQLTPLLTNEENVTSK